MRKFKLRRYTTATQHTSNMAAGYKVDSLDRITPLASLV